MNHELTALPADLGPGLHHVRLRAIQETHDARFGTTLLWHFVCVDGDYKGHVHTRRTGSQLKPAKSLWALIAGMLGRDLNVGEAIDTNDLIKQRFRLCLRREVRDGAEIVVFDSIAPLKD